MILLYKAVLEVLQIIEDSVQPTLRLCHVDVKKVFNERWDTGVQLTLRHRLSSMTMLRTLPIILAALLTAFEFSEVVAAERKKWETLTHCQYVEDKNNDGDNFRVKCGEKDFVLRLYFVDAPEATLTYPERVRLQSEHFGITLDATLKAGARARERTQELLREPFVVRTRWASAAGRGRETRYYGIVEAGGKSLAEVLVSEGLAQTRGVAPNLPSSEKASAYMERLEGLEREARQKRLGAWASAPEEKKKKAKR